MLKNASREHKEMGATRSACACHVYTIHPLSIFITQFRKPVSLPQALHDHTMHQNNCDNILSKLPLFRALFQDSTFF